MSPILFLTIPTILENKNNNENQYTEDRSTTKIVVTNRTIPQKMGNIQQNIRVMNQPQNFRKAS
jgi:hypothetical protein